MCGYLPIVVALLAGLVTHLLLDRWLPGRRR